MTTKKKIDSAPSVKQSYLRDGRAPIPNNEVISRVMSANKGKNTKPEVLLRKHLWNEGVKGYRVNWRKAPGRPDICFPGKKVAIFIHGCFWHRCPSCNRPLPKTNTEFWQAKFEHNQERDSRKIAELEKNGWKVLVIWECQLKRNLSNCSRKIRELL